MSDSYSSQPLYLRLLLDEQDPEEIWDSCFTSAELYGSVPDQEVLDAAEQADIDLLWCNEITDEELLSVKMDALQSSTGCSEECANFSLGYDIDSDEDRHPDAVFKVPAVPVKRRKRIIVPRKAEKKTRTFRDPVPADVAESMKFKMFAPDTRKINWAMTMYSQWRALHQDNSPDLDKCVENL